MTAALVTVRLIRQVPRFATLQATDRRLLVEALAALLAARLAIALLPLGKLKSALRWRWHRRFDLPSPTVERIVWAVRRAAEWVPATTCLVQAMAALRLLESAGYDARLTLGTAKSATGQLTAHAWVSYHDRVVLGAASDTVYTPILAWQGARFHSPR